MSGYEGLNLPQLLEKLHGLVVPEPVSFFPQTVGWLVLLIWVVVVLAIVLAHTIILYRRNRYRREALAALDEVAATAAADQQGAMLAVIVKRVAMVTFGREQIAPLYGTEWAVFLARTVNRDPLVEPHVSAIANAAYQSSDARLLFAPARRWIEKHHD